MVGFEESNCKLINLGKKFNVKHHLITNYKVLFFSVQNVKIEEEVGICE